MDREIPVDGNGVKTPTSASRAYIYIYLSIYIDR